MIAHDSEPYTSDSTGNLMTMRSALSGTRRADGRWQITITLTRPDGAKVKKTLYAATQREVQDKARALIHESKRRASVSVTVADLLDICTEGPWRDHAPKTIEQYAWARIRILPALGTEKVADLRVPDVATWVRKMEMDPNLSGRSAQICRDVLRSALTHAVEMGWCERNVAKEVRMKHARSSTPDRRRLSEVEYMGVIEAEAHGVYRNLWRTIGECGLRPFREAVTMKRENLVRSVDTWWFVVSSSKTTKGERSVPVPDDLADILSEVPAGELLFPSSTGTVLDSRRVGRRWAEALERAGVPHTNLYQLRKLAITRWSLQGLPDAVVKELSGHTDIRLTQNVYARPARDHIVQSLEDAKR